jgi:Lamin Tail Domain
LRTKLIVTLLAVVVLLAIPASASAAVKIREIFYNSPGSDTGSNKSLNAEWVLLKNTGSRKVRMTGWTVRDVAGHVYRFGAFRLGGGKSVKVHTGHGSNTAMNRFWGQSWYIWNNNGDTATLKRRNGTVSDRCHYSDSSESDDHVNC